MEVTFTQFHMMAPLFPEISLRIKNTGVVVETFVNDRWVSESPFETFQDLYEKIASVFPWTAEVTWEYRRRPDISGGAWQVFGFMPLLKSEPNLPLLPEVVNAAD